MIIESKSKVGLFGLLFVIVVTISLLWVLQTKPHPVYEGGTLRLGGLGGKPMIINPLLTDRTISQALLQLIFNNLVRFNKEMMIEPDIAESWEISKDGLTYTFHLRKDIRFHDGVELTSEDVKFTYESARDPEINYRLRSYYDVVKTFEAPDKYTFCITLKEPKANLLNLMDIPIVPKHLLSSFKGQALRNAEFNRKPIGTGPFRFVEWSNTPLNPVRLSAHDEALLIEGTSDPATNSPLLRTVSPQDEPVKRGVQGCVILEANPDYYEGAPSLNRIIATGYDDMNQYWSGFMRGENDVAFFLPKEQYEIARRDPEIRSYSFPYPYTYGLEYNLDHPFLQDKKVRTALAYGINAREIINKVESGYGIPSTGPFLPGIWSSNPDIKPLEYNPALALKLLQEAGWNLNKNNVLEKDGQEFRITMLVNEETRQGQMMAMLIYQDIYKLGIRIDIKPFDYKKKGESPFKELALQSAVYLTTFTVMNTPDELISEWYSGYQNKRMKLWTYYNTEIDRLFDLGQITTDINKRQTIYHQIHKTIYEDQAVTFLYFLPHLAAVNARFHNTDGVFSPIMPFWTIKDWRYESKRLKD